MEQPRSPSITNDHSGHEKSAAEAKKNFSLPVIIMETADQQRSAREREQKTDKHDEANLQAQRQAAQAADRSADVAEWMKTPTWAQIILASLGTISVLVALYFAYQANRIAETTGKRQLRAYLTVDVKKALILNPEREVMRVQIRIENNGQTPAMYIRSGTLLTIKPHHPPIGTLSVAEDRESASATGSSSILGSGKRLIVNKEFPCLTKNDCLELQRSNERLYIIGIVRYRDIFQEDHTTKFCFLLKTGHLMRALDRYANTPVSIETPPAAIKGDGFSRANQWNEMS
ncbi:hypothetical protein [Hansschlegelia sp.]|uniref:hypothetical protein n=1 Tax=Hansschlegelia sp. TaxID=2041892 RepID=UPI002BABA2F4|nr:hypothetical protein [Hansschlegelia sp.]HVI28877.1 hypothetical protein [Hansschlegelia sp.]